MTFSFAPITLTRVLKGAGTSARQVLQQGKILFFAVLFFSTLPALAQQVQPKLPLALEHWKDWVLAKHPSYGCPWLGEQNTQQCQWAERLELKAEQNGGSFQYDVLLYQQGWVTLPGDVRSWPQQVQHKHSDGLRTVEVRDNNGVPEVFLAAGGWRLLGNFHWQQLPHSIRVPQQSGVLTLTLNGQVLTAPKRLGDNLWLQPQSQPSETSTDNLQLKVFRLVDDDIPASVTTMLVLDVSGKSREILLDGILLKGFKPKALQADLPALLREDGKLQLQLSAGQWEVSLESVGQQAPAEFQLPATTAPWPVDEIWAFVAHPELRTVNVSGVNSLDPNQTLVPSLWQQYPLYAMDKNSKLQLTEIQRGGGQQQDNLRLEKQLWLDFSGKGITVSDDISGTLHSQARLEVQPGYQLGRVELDGEPQLITTMPEQQPGVELRQNPIQLKALSRTELNNSELKHNGLSHTFAVSGWQNSFNEVNWQLHLPPGWSLFSASGVDHIDGSLLERWTLWDIFFVLLFSVASGRLFGWAIGVLALLTLVLSYHRIDAPQWSWLSLLALLALLPLAKGKIQPWVQKATYLNVLVILVVLIPFSVDQIRQAIYPQLEQPFLLMQAQSAQMVAAAPVAMATAAGQQADAMAEAYRQERAETAKKASVAEQRNATNSYTSPIPILKADPNARIQTGPAEPAWQWRQVRLSWQGPLLAQEQTQLYLVPAWLNRFGNVFTVFLLATLLLLLCKPLIPESLLSRTLSSGQIMRIFRPAKTQLPVIFMLLCAGLVLPSPPAYSQQIPDAALLAELEQRLLEPPVCLPGCSSLGSVKLQNSGDHQLHLTLTLDSQLHHAWLLPVAADKILAVKLNQQNAAIYHHEQQSYLLLPQGRHQLELWLAATEPQLVLNFSSAWHHLTDELQGWRLMPDNSDPNDLTSLQQARTQLRLEQIADVGAPSTTTTSLAQQQNNLPAFAVLERRLTLGLEWQLTSTLRRTGQSQQALQLTVPLLPGETPLSPLPVVNGALQLQLNANQQTLSWNSTLKQNSQLQLQTVKQDLTSEPQQQSYTEIWQLAASPKWHIKSQGVTAVTQSDNPLASLWRPWPGEHLTLDISQPQAVAGEVLTVNQLALRQQQGNRSSDVELRLQLNASQAQSFVLPLPANAQLQSVKLDGMTLPATVNEQQLKVQLKPGQQQLQINWQENTGQSLFTQSSALTLPLPAANIYLEMALAQDRWILALGGPAIGPALLFWGMLFVVLVIALLLPKLIQSPLKRRHWLLLFAGISTVSFWIPVLIALWFAAISRRGQISVALKGSQGRITQLGLLLFSITALLALFSAIPYGLLSAPDMQLVGNGSYQQQLYWYQDFSQQQLPQAWVLSLPLWCYQLAMLLWSLWLATALTRWLPWIWQQLSHLGFWPAAKTPVTAQNTSQTEDAGALAEISDTPQAETNNQS